jgi:hypothetical protein
VEDLAGDDARVVNGLNQELRYQSRVIEIHVKFLFSSLQKTQT